jgi:lipopolysaccharide exporter
LPRQTLKEATFSGVRWAVFARGGSEVLMFAGAIATARLIPPADFGRAAVALLLVPLATILTFEGFASVLVQRKAVDAAHRETATFASVAAGALLTLVTLLFARFAAEPVFGTETATLMAVMAPIFVLAGVGAVPRALLWRELDFRAVGSIEVLGLLSGTVCTVALAFAGVDGEALVIGALVTTGTRSALLITRMPPARPRWHREAYDDIVRFGGPAAFAGMVGVLLANIPYAILAARSTALQTGIYWRSFQLGVTYQDKVSGVMLQVAFPVYSRTENREELGRLHERASRVLAASVIPLLGGLIVLAPIFVPWVFGPQWVDAVVPTQILCGAGMIAATLTGYPQVMLALGEPRALARFNVAALALYVVVIWTIAPLGIITVAVGTLAWYAVILFAVYGVLLRRHLDLPMRRMVTDLGPALTCCAVLVGAGFAARWALEHLGAGDVLTMAGTGAVCSAAYVAAMAVLFPSLWKELVMLARRVAPSRRPRRTVVTQPAPEPTAS